MNNVVGKSVGGGVLLILFFVFVKAEKSASRSYPEYSVMGFVYGCNRLMPYWKTFRQYGADQ